MTKQWPGETVRLFDGVTADGNSTEYEWVNAGSGLLQLSGDFGGGTATLQLSLDDGITWADTDAVFTAAGVKNVEILGGCELRLSLAGSSAANLNAWISR